MNNDVRLRIAHNAIHEIALQLAEVSASMQRTGDPTLQKSADLCKDAYASLMDAASEVRAAIKFEKESRNGPEGL